jgi:TRAP-type mannitol/chloroaromatic compound transport system substrate-binding protein
VTILSWLQGNSIPQGAEILSIAGLLGVKVYEVLGQPVPDPELLKTYNSFSHLTGEFRGKLAQALWEAQTEMHQKSVTANSEEAKIILSEAFKKWGVSDVDSQES